MATLRVATLVALGATALGANAVYAADADQGGGPVRAASHPSHASHGKAAAAVSVRRAAPIHARRSNGDGVPKSSASRSARATTRPTSVVVPASGRPGYAERPDVRAYVDDLVAHSDLDRDTLLRRLADARYSETAARLMAPATSAGVRRDWTVYRARFVEPVRLAVGLAYWDEHEADLARAEREFGVPAEIIVGILGVETVYGRNTGSFRVLDALATLSFDYPATPGRDRSAFFREQLADAFAMDRAGTIDLGTLRGSYAGAIGMPQFMPGSIRQFAVDFDGDGRIDLVGDAADIVGSVANFLARHGWVRDLPTQIPLAHPDVVDAAQAARIDGMVAAGSAPSLEFADLVAAGFVATTMPPLDRLALIDLPSGIDATGAPRTAYVAGTQNFHALTRYNRSYFYAMSVIELGGTIRALREGRR